MVSISASAIAPIAYLALVVGSLITFSSIYRRRKAIQSANLEPWFPSHHERDVYLSLVHLENPACQPNLLKAALLERAAEDISRIYILREKKVAANNLLQRGSLSETTFQQITNAEAEMNLEIQDVMAEARALGGDDWARDILAQANECYQKNLLLKSLEKFKTLAETEKKKWEETQRLRNEFKNVQRELALKELSEGDDKTGSKLTNGDESGTAVDAQANGNGVNTQDNLAERKSKKKKNKK